MRAALLPAPRLLRSALVIATAASLLVAGLAATSAPSSAQASPAVAERAGSVGSAQTAGPAQAERRPNRVTPGNFTGYGFDQCVAPTQREMNVWLKHSPFLAVGIYISGKSRGCRNQPNLTPDWVRTQLRKGWRLLPITLGPQASCHPSFPRYSDDFSISPKPGPRDRYKPARRMGRNSAKQSVADAKALGIRPGSTLWYDLEGFDIGNRHCRESALSFLNAWVRKVEKLGYVSGVYSSAGSGIKMLDDVRVNRPKAYKLPERIWLADWNGRANTSSTYVRDGGWRPGDRVKQYRGPRTESHGGVRIDIDRNYLDLGRGSVAPRERHCGGVRVNYRDYVPLRPRGGGYVAPKRYVRTLQCLLKEHGAYNGKINGNYHKGLERAVREWKDRRGRPVSNRWWRADWMTVLAAGSRPVSKVGSAGRAVRRAQRALNAAKLGESVRPTGVYNGATTRLARRYQRKVDLPVTGHVTWRTWYRLAHGVRR